MPVPTDLAGAAQRSKGGQSKENKIKIVNQVYY